MRGPAQPAQLSPATSKPLLVRQSNLMHRREGFETEGPQAPRLCAKMESLKMRGSWIQKRSMNDPRVKSQESTVKSQESKSQESKSQESRVKSQRVKESRFKSQESRDKSQESRVKRQESRVKSQESSVKSQESRVKGPESRVKESRVKSHD
jgi:hypothetical protein